MDKFLLRSKLRQAEVREQRLRDSNKELKRTLKAAVDFMTNNPMPHGATARIARDGGNGGSVSVGISAPEIVAAAEAALEA
jgi:hypothetical protein